MAQRASPPVPTQRALLFYRREQKKAATLQPEDDTGKPALTERQALHAAWSYWNGSTKRNNYGDEAKSKSHMLGFMVPVPSLLTACCSSWAAAGSLLTSSYTSAPELVALDLGFLLLREDSGVASRACSMPGSTRLPAWRPQASSSAGRQPGSRTPCTICALRGHLSWKDSHCTTSWSLPRDLPSSTAGCS